MDSGEVGVDAMSLGDFQVGSRPVDGVSDEDFDTYWNWLMFTVRGRWSLFVDMFSGSVFDEDGGGVKDVVMILDPGEDMESLEVLETLWADLRSFYGGYDLAEEALVKMCLRALASYRAGDPLFASDEDGVGIAGTRSMVEKDLSQWRPVDHLCHMVLVFSSDEGWGYPLDLLVEVCDDGSVDGVPIVGWGESERR